MAKEVKILALANRQILISEIEEVGSADIGEPDCKLINPFVITKDKTLEPFLLNEDNTLSPWLVGCTNDNEFMMSSDKILTLVEPKPTILEKYQDLLK